MKLLLGLALSSMIVLLSGCANMGGCGGGTCGGSYTCSYGCYSGMSCSCTDPSCFNNGSCCIGTGNCCRAFGNIAGNPDC